ncbi:hypothetical protein Tco_0375204 [Tanacetum coccineum]
MVLVDHTDANLRRRQWKTGHHENLIEQLKSDLVVALNMMVLKLGYCGKSEPIFYNYLKPLTSLDEGLAPRFKATLEEITNEAGSITANKNEKIFFTDVRGCWQIQGLSHDESFGVDDMDLNLNESVNLNVSQVETQSNLPKLKHNPILSEVSTQEPIVAEVSNEVPIVEEVGTQDFSVEDVVVEDYGRKIADLDADEEVNLIDETQERYDEEMLFDVQDDLQSEEVVTKQEVAEKEVSATDPITTACEVVTTASATTTIDELTLAQTLIEIKAAKPKVVTTSATTITTDVASTRPKAK